MFRGILDTRFIWQIIVATFVEGCDDAEASGRVRLVRWTLVMVLAVIPSAMADRITTAMQMHTAQNPSHTDAVAGTYVVNLTVTDAADHTTTKTTGIQIDPLSHHGPSTLPSPSRRP